MIASIPPLMVLPLPALRVPRVFARVPAIVRRPLRVALLTLLLFLVLGNLVIVVASQLQSRLAHVAADPVVAGVPNLHAVDAAVWRSAAPSSRAYDDLARAGVTTVVDLRAEEDVHVDAAALADLGIRYRRMPIRDGQTPTPAQVAAFLSEVRRAPGITLVHCGAGVGRTGAMVAAYLVETGEADGRTAMKRNLAVGPPSLEQLAFAARLDGGVARPPVAVTVMSRVLDAPRRLWSRYGL